MDISETSEMKLYLPTCYAGQGDATPARLLALRLEKLEKDLQLLTGMQTLLMGDGGQVNTFRQCCDLPERDSNKVFRPQSSVRKRESSQQQQQSNSMDEERTVYDSNAGTWSRINGRKRGEDTTTTSHDIIVDCNNPDNLELLETVKLEREKRIELEDSAKRVALKLQKAEDELERERETKQMLLVGTLQLKNQISGQESHIIELEADLKKFQSESASWKDKVQVVTNGKASTEKKYKEIIQALKADKKNLEADKRQLLESKTNIELQLEEKKKYCEIQEQNLLSQDQKTVSKMNQMIAKCAQLSKERQNLALELRSTLEKLQLSDQELKSNQESLQKIQLESEREQMLHDCLLKKLKGDMNNQKQRFEQQILHSQTVVSKTKSLIIQVRKERDDLRSILHSCKEENHEFQVKMEEAVGRFDLIRNEYDNFKEKTTRLMENYQINMEKTRKENSSLKSLVKTLRNEKDLQTKLALSSENDFLKQKTVLDDQLRTLLNENEKLKSEISKLSDSLKIQQKVSDDQTKTIQTLRLEKEEQRKLKFSLETELRERDANEAVLMRKFEQEQRKSTRLEETIEEYQAKVSAMAKELEDHNCEDFVESGFKQQLEEIESDVKVRYEEWQQSLHTAHLERDKAIRSARKYEKTAEEAKAECESQILEITTSTKNEYQKLKMEYKRLAAEKASKIMELESELDQMKLQSSQIQRSLTGKIQQLQCALNICVTTSYGHSGQSSFSNFL